jgi:hypothetical protein
LGAREASRGLFFSFRRHRTLLPLRSRLIYDVKSYFVFDVLKSQLLKSQLVKSQLVKSQLSAKSPITTVNHDKAVCGRNTSLPHLDLHLHGTPVRCFFHRINPFLDRELTGMDHRT